MKIVFNGSQYASPEEMPADVRRSYDQAMAMFADEDKDGVPDVFEGVGGKHVIAIQHSSITVNGKTYGGVEEMPEPVRKVFEWATREAGAAGDASGLATSSDATWAVRVDGPASTADDPRRAHRSWAITGTVPMGWIVAILLALVLVALLVLGAPRP